ncbi:MAG: hypothetical protein WDA27_09260 [Actinomycetota bacterium]
MAAPAKSTAADEGHAPPEIDEAVFAEQIAAGKSEREARAMAKKAWILARKKAAAGSPTPEVPAPGAAPPAAAPAVPAPEATPTEEHAPPQIDEAVYAEQIAAGKSEREARAMAKKAWVLKRKRGEA